MVHYNNVRRGGTLSEAASVHRPAANDDSSELRSKELSFVIILTCIEAPGRLRLTVTPFVSH